MSRETPSPLQHAALRAAFNQFDSDGDGQISYQEMARVLNKLRQPLGAFALFDLFDKFDRNHDGVIDFGEFLRLVSDGLAGMNHETELRLVFRLFDQDGDGHITAEELLRVLRSLDPRYEREQVEAMLAAADQNADDQITYDEFRTLMLHALQG